MSTTPTRVRRGATAFLGAAALAGTALLGPVTGGAA
jgi:hypothetical protein